MGRKSVTERSDNRLLRLGFDRSGIDEAVFSTHTLQDRLSKCESSPSRSPNVYCKPGGQTFHSCPVNTSFPVLRAKNQNRRQFQQFRHCFLESLRGCSELTANRNNRESGRKCRKKQVGVYRLTDGTAILPPGYSALRGFKGDCQVNSGSRYALRHAVSHPLTKERTSAREEEL
jgi:hypothetical protein